MHCAACENRIKNNLKYEKGIQGIEAKAAEQKVVVTYDAEKTNEERLLKAFEKFKYKARIVKADEKIEINEHEECDMM